MGLKSGLLVAIMLFTFSVKGDDSNVTTITPLETNIRLRHFDTAWAPFMDNLELKLLQQHPSYLPVNTPQYNEHYTRGIYFEGENGKILGYAITGGMFEGTYWKFAFDVEVTSALRARMLLMITPYVLEKMRKLQSEWRDFRAEQDRPMELRVRVDFLNTDSAVHRWILDIFGNYNEMFLEDTAKGKEIKIADLRKNSSSDIMVGKGPAKVITGFQFGKVYSSNLKKMVDITTDGTIVVIDTRNGRTLGTVLAPEYGTPKIKIDSTQLVLDYGTGKKRYHYNVGDYKLLYTVDNWQAPARPNPVTGGQCRDIFSF